MPPDVVLVQMPWAHPGRPSIALGLLQPVLAGARLATQSWYLNFDFFEHVVATCRALPIATLLEVLPQFGKSGLSAWTFAVAPLVDGSRRDVTEAWLADLRARLRVSAARRPVDRWLDAAREIREAVPAFLEQSCAALRAAAPRVVGFTTSLDQLVPSLVLARLLKERAPEIRLVLGGAECRSTIGVALHRAFPWLDAVVRGDAERLAPPVFGDLVHGRPPEPVPGVTVGRDGVVLGAETLDGRVEMEEVPAPDFDAYFARLGASPLRAALRPALPYQMSRGCWWGEHHRCGFCSRDESAVPFRRKSAARVAAELRTLATRSGLREVELVDDNLHPDTVSEALEQLQAEGLPLTVGWCQGHPSLGREQLRRLRAAGVRFIFSGIESLSSPILRLVHKGTTALTSVRFLRWCAELGLVTRWNLLYGVPGETATDYERMADLMRSVTHLTPPYRPLPVDLRRFSPYFDAPERYGIEVGEPAAVRRFFARCVDADPRALALSFEYRVRGQPDPESYVGPALAAHAEWLRARVARSSLVARRDGDTLRIDDRRANLAAREHALVGHEAAVYLACDAGAAPDEILAALGPGATAAEVAAILGRLAEERLVLEDEGRYLALALPG